MSLPLRSKFLKEKKIVAVPLESHCICRASGRASTMSMQSTTVTFSFFKIVNTKDFAFEKKLLL